MRPLACAVAAKATGIADSVETLEAWRYIVTAGFGVASLLAQVWLIVEGVLLTREIRENGGYAPPLTPTAHA